MIGASIQTRDKRTPVLRAPPGSQANPLYWVWRAMFQRCTNPKAKPYRWYGARGISVCERWKDFDNFVVDMGPRPPGTSIDRINNNGNYEPSNCRWATRGEQGANMRTSINIEFRGETLTLRQWSLRIGITDMTLRARFKRGWSLEKSLTTPGQITGIKRRSHVA